MRQLLIAACVCGLLLVSVAADCHDGACFNSEMLKVDVPRGRSLQQPAGWGGTPTGCGAQPITVVYAGQKPDIGSLASDLESTLTNVAIGTHESFQVVIDDKSVGYASLTDPESCIRKLTTFRGGLVIYDDGSITDLSALANVKSVNGPLVVYGNADAKLTTLAGLEGIKSVAHLNIAHTKLTSLAGLSGLSTINGDLIAWDNANLVSLQGLGPVTQLFGKLWMDTNPKLQDMTGLEGLTQVFDDAVFVDCGSLKSLAGLGSLTKLGKDLVLRNLRSLTSTTGMGNITSVGQSIIFMQLPQLQDIAALRGIQAAGGDLQLYLIPNVPDLTALANLQSVKLNLVVSGLDGIKNLQGLNNVRSVGLLLSVSFNGQLETMQGLNNLQSIGQDLAIRGNPQLTALQGMTQSLTSIGTYRGTDIFIEDNPKLADLAGLEASKVAVYGDVTVQRNSPSLPESQVNALKGKAQPVPITIETLMNGLPSNVSRPAASGK